MAFKMRSMKRMVLMVKNYFNKWVDFPQADFNCLERDARFIL